MIVLIYGSRHYPRLDQVRALVDLLPPETVVISGGAEGVDRYAVACVRQRGLQAHDEQYRPDWAKYGKAAGPLRNARMVKDCDIAYGFWDGQSRGTRHTTRMARAAGKLGYEFDVLSAITLEGWNEREVSLRHNAELHAVEDPGDSHRA